jgi:hypothetical protein
LSDASAAPLSTPLPATQPPTERSRPDHTPEGLVLYPVAKLWKILTLLLGVAVIITSLGMSYAATILATAPRWDLLGFELITLSAGVIAILFGMGKFREGPGLALLAVAGTVFAAAILGFVGVGQQITLKDQPVPMSLRTYVVVRIAIAATFAAISVLLVLTRNKAALTAALKSLYAWVPIAIILAAIYKRGVITNALASAPQFIAPTLGVIAGLALIGFLAAAVHMTIRAFELARHPEEDLDQPA